MRCFLPARDGSLWVAVPRGLHRSQGGQDRWFTTADGLGADDVRALLETRDGTLWAGTARGGLSRSTGGTDRSFTTLTRRDGLSRDTVWALLEDRDGVLWAGTDGGLDRIEQGRITSFGPRQGLPDGGVNSLLEDDDGHLWIGHDHGIYRVGREEFSAVAAGRAARVRCVPFGVADGMAVAECNGQTATPAAVKTADGRLWFATPKGVVVVDPHAVLARDMPPLVAIEEVRADEEAVFLSAPGGDDAWAPALEVGHRAMRTGMGHQGPGTLSPTRLAPGRGRVMEFHFTALSFVAPEKCRFLFQLEGYERPDVWHDAGSRRLAHYTNLDPGDYRFRVLAVNHHNIRSEVPATFAFSLAPFVWQTWWSKVGVLFSACGLVLLVVRWRIRESRHLADLTARISERSRLARDMHDHLGAHVAELSQLGGLLERLPPAGAGPFRQRLAELTGDISRSLRDIAWATTPLSDDLPHLLDHLAGAAGRQLRSAGIALVVDFPPQVPAWPVTGPRRHDLLLAVQEAVTNAAKHSGATEVVLRFRLAPEAFVVEVADNGRGLPVKTMAPGPVAGSVGGFGLSNLRHRAAQLGGSVEFVDVPGSGLTVRFRVPKQPPAMKSR